MATITQVALEFAFTISGNPPMVLSYPEAASQTFVQGELVYLASGYVTECTNASNKISSLILGVAADPGNNGTAGANNIGVYIANQDSIFSANLTTTGTSIVTHLMDVGAVVALYADTTNSHIHADGTRGAGNVLVHEATYPRAVIVAHDKRDDVGDTGGRVLIRFLSQFSQVYSTS